MPLRCFNRFPTAWGEGEGSVAAVCGGVVAVDAVVERLVGVDAGPVAVAAGDHMGIRFCDARSAIFDLRGIRVVASQCQTKSDLGIKVRGTTESKSSPFKSAWQIVCIDRKSF